MVFSTSIFIYLFLPITLLIYYIAPKKSKNFIILLSGLVFYSWGEPIYVVVMLISTMIDYFAGLVMNHFEGKKLPRKLCLIVSVVMNLGLLGVFKYSGFIAENINAIAGSQIIDINNMNFFGIDFLPMNMLPIGISFFTFQSMSYTIDLYMGNVKVQKNPISFAAFVTLFPQIVAGPIVRYDDVAKELDDRTITIDLIYDGIIRFIIGLSKKVLIANSIGALWTAVKSTDISQVSVVSSWLGILAFTFQIYFDFSGYSDMAIGLGKMMGFHFPENFNYPYLSKSISEFWRRWHISLSSWLKKYIYIPLGGNRHGRIRRYINILITFLISGAWHGNSLTYIVWGLFHGICNLFSFTQRASRKIVYFLQILFTFLCVTIGWIIFRSTSLNMAFLYIKHMFIDIQLNTTAIVASLLPFTSDYSCLAYFVSLCILIIILFYVELCEFRQKVTCLYLQRNYIFILCIIFFGIWGQSNFLYANF